jgi:hypothetical protein
MDAKEGLNVLLCTPSSTSSTRSVSVIRMTPPIPDHSFGLRCLPNTDYCFNPCSLVVVVFRACRSSDLGVGCRSQKYERCLPSSRTLTFKLVRGKASCLERASLQ